MPVSGRWSLGPLGIPSHAFSPFRLKLNSKRNQLVRELEEAALQVAALHSQLKRCVGDSGLTGGWPDAGVPRWPSTAAALHVPSVAGASTLRSSAGRRLVWQTRAGPGVAEGRVLLSRAQPLSPSDSPEAEAQSGASVSCSRLWYLSTQFHHTEKVGLRPGPWWATVYRWNLITFCFHRVF